MKNNYIFIALFVFLNLCACVEHNAGTTSVEHNANVQYSLAVSSQQAIHSSHPTVSVRPISVSPQMQMVPASSIVKSPRSSASNVIGEDAIAMANKKASQIPSSSHYMNSTMTFDYMSGALFQIYCAPLRVTDVEFQKGEHVISVGAGDTLRWQVSKTFSGSGVTRSDHLLIKPIEEDLINSTVVTTDQRTYHLILRSTSNTYMASVAWNYPGGDGLVEKFGDNQVGIDKSTSNIDAVAVGSGVDINHLDFRYKIKLVQGYTPDWYPKMVFHDGKKTYIMLPLQMQEAPTLFIGNNAKNDQIINYRVQGNYYVIDGVFGQIQLRSGQNGQVVVQISYIAGG